MCLIRFDSAEHKDRFFSSAHAQRFRHKREPMPHSDANKCRSIKRHRQHPARFSHRSLGRRFPAALNCSSIERSAARGALTSDIVLLIWAKTQNAANQEALKASLQHGAERTAAVDHQHDGQTPKCCRTLTRPLANYTESNSEILLVCKKSRMHR